MTEPQGWTAPGSGSAGDAAPPPGYGPPPPGYGPPPPGYGPPPPGQWYGGPPPAPAPGVVPLRPLGVGELLDGAIKVVRRYPRPTLGLSALIAVLVTLVNVAFVVALGADTGSGLDGTDPAYEVGVSVGRSGPGGLLSYLAGLVLTGALVVVVGKAVLGQAVETSEVWAQVRGRLWALLGLSLLTGLLTASPAFVAVLLGVLLGFALGVPGIVAGVLVGLAGVAVSIHLYARLALAPAALVLERAGIRTALRRSGVLVKGAWWRTFWILVLTVVITTFLSTVIAAPAAVFLGVSGSQDSIAAGVVTQVVAGLVSVVVAPFSAGVRALLYVDRRMRAEGLDVALQAAAAGAPGASPA